MNKEAILKAFKRRYLKTDDGWILDGTNGAEIEKWLLSALDDLERETREKVEKENYDRAYNSGFVAGVREERAKISSSSEKLPKEEGK